VPSPTNPRIVDCATVIRVHSRAALIYQHATAEPELKLRDKSATWCGETALGDRGRDGATSDTS
jgi:hypothetical protein